MAVEIESATTSNGEGTSGNVSMPSNRPDGDLYLTAITISDDLTISAPGTGGWQLVAQNATSAGTDGAGGVWQTIGASLASSYTWAWSETEDWSAIVLRMTGFDADDPINAVGTPLGDNTSPATFPSATPTVDGGKILRILCMKNTNEPAVTVADHQLVAEVRVDTACTYIFEADDESEANVSTGGATTNNYGPGFPWVSFTLVIAPDAEAPHADVDVSISGGGHIGVTASTDRSASVDLSGGGAPAVTAATARQAAVAISGGGSVSTEATTDRAANPHISGGGGIITEPTTHRSVAVAISGGGHITVEAAQDARHVEVPVSISGGGNVAVTATTQRAGAPSISGGGAMAVMARTERAPDARVSGGGHVEVLAFTARRAAVAISGGGTITVIVFHATRPGRIEHRTVGATVTTRVVASSARTRTTSPSIDTRVE